jgi:hypothetical protein
MRPQDLENRFDRFELFGERPFLQVPSLERKRNAVCDKLDFGLSAGNNTTLYDQAAVPSGRSHESGWLALMLLTYQCFSPGGLIGENTWGGVGTGRTSEHAPCIEGSPQHLILRGDTLLHTLHLNLMTRKQIASLPNAEWGEPVWDNPPTGSGMQQGHATSYLSRLVPMPRAIRAQAQELQPAFFAGTRSRYIVDKLAAEFEQAEVAPSVARALAERTADAVGKLDEKSSGNVKTLLYFSPMELHSVATAVLEAGGAGPAALLADEQTDKKARGKALSELDGLAKKASKRFAAQVKDAADIAVFGRMVADDHSLTVEDAGMFSHALSTHKTSNEVDFFSAVDDLKPVGRDDAGAGHIGTNELNAACYYRCIALNLDLLLRRIPPSEPRRQGRGPAFPAAPRTGQHTRGDAPCSTSGSSALSTLSPHPWGCSAPVARSGPLAALLPTPVGMLRNQP